MSVHEGGLQAGTPAEREETTELFTHHASAIYRYCLRRLGSREEAEDALQVTYLNAWRSLKRGCRPQARRAWLFQIAANVCASSLRTKLGGTRVELREPEDLDELATYEEPESEELLGLTEALRELPSRQRHALVLRDWRGLSYDEIAAEMAVSDAAVETLLFRARTKVAATLAGGEWRAKAATSARALLVWPFAFLHPKAATTGAGNLKVGLGLAGGTVAPLVAFGLIQALLLGPHQTTQPSGTRGVLQGAQPELPASWLPEGRFLHTVTARAVDEERGVGTKRKRGKHARAAHEPNSPGPAHPPSPAPAPAASQEAKIVLCHGTASNAQPGVTISVSAHSLRGLSQDAHGACG